MKKLLFALALGVLLVAAFATTALADNGPHGGFNGATDACASCHRAHSAISSDGYLLVASNVYALCTSCHDGTGAITNVVDGYYEATTAGTHTAKSWKSSLPTTQGQDGMGLFAGGFTNTRMLTDYGHGAGALAGSTNNSATAWAVTNTYDAAAAAPVSRATTSGHVVSGGTGTLWGSGVFQTTATTSPFGAQTGVALECTSCHDPHGNSGKSGGSATGVPMPSYRLLRFTPTGSNGFEGATTVTGPGGTTTYWNLASTTGVTVPDLAAKWYTPNTDVTIDPSVKFWSARGTTSIYAAAIAGLGDYGGRYYTYRRPSITAGTTVSNGTTSYFTCATPAAGSYSTLCGASLNNAAYPDFNNLAAHDVMGFWCATCHDRYLAPGGAATTPSVNPLLVKGGSRDTDTNDPGYHFRHRSQGVNTSTTSGYNVNATNQYYTGVGQYTCIDCHNAHGTSAVADALASSATYAGDSALLKADNRAICLRCHATSINFFNTTVSPSAVMVTPP